jgi:hypothetical protein
MPTIFFVFADTPDEGPVFHGFRSTLGLAVKRCTEILETTNYDGTDELFIAEYVVDGDLPAVNHNIYGATDAPMATYNHAGVKINNGR